MLLGRKSVFCCFFEKVLLYSAICHRPFFFCLSSKKYTHTFFLFLILLIRIVFYSRKYCRTFWKKKPIFIANFFFCENHSKPASPHGQVELCPVAGDVSPAPPQRPGPHHHFVLSPAAPPPPLLPRPEGEHGRGEDDPVGAGVGAHLEGQGQGGGGRGHRYDGGVPAREKKLNFYSRFAKKKSGTSATEWYLTSLYI